MITQAHTQMFMGFLSAAAHIANKRTESDLSQHQLLENAARLEHERGVFESKAALMRDLVGALVEKRVDAVKAGFSEVLSLYTEQARHYMEQQRRYTDELMKLDDPLHRAEYTKHINDADLALQQIRRDARRVYNQMTEIVLLLGGVSFEMTPDSRVSLGFDGMRPLPHA